MEHQIFIHRHRVTYAECTIGNHVYYSRYLDLLEEARGEFFRSLGQPFLAWQERGFAFPVIELSLRYARPARYDDVLAIRLWIELLHGARLHFAGRIENQRGELVLEAETRHVCASLEEKPRRLPAELIAVLTPFLKPEA